MSGEAPKAGGTGIRSMRARDAIAASAIIREIPGTALWTAESLIESLAAGFLGWVAERDGEVAGVLIGRIVADEFEIMNLAVDPDDRRKGIATALVDSALDSARSEGCKAAHLEVRASNAAAIGLYRARGFAETGRRKRYYDNPIEDALLLTHVDTGKY